MTYAAPPGNGLPIQRNYGIAPGNEKHQPVSTNTSCLNIHLLSISNVDADADFHSNVDADSNVDIDADSNVDADADIHSNVDANADSNVDTDADGAFWAG